MKASLIVLLPLLAASTALGAKYTVYGTSDLWLAGAARQRPPTAVTS
jgi:hypothetical protein